MSLNIHWNKKSVIRWKVYIDRAKMYMSYINFMMLGIIFFKGYEDTNWGQYVFSHYYFTVPLMIISFFLFSLVLGYIDSKMGFRKEEMRNLSASNPVEVEILQTVKEQKANIEVVNSQSNK